MRMHQTGGRRRRTRGGFILFFGTRSIVSNDPKPPVRTRCPKCGRETDVLSKSARQWFTLFFIPVFPIGAKKHFSECSNCHARFGMAPEQLQTKVVAAIDERQGKQAIALYNSLRNSPANSITLNDLMMLYASMNEFDQAIHAAGDFQQALHNSEQCMTTLGRIYLAKGQHAEALQWLDSAVARNDQLAEAHYYKAVTLLTMVPPDPQRAAASARTARNLGFANADALLREAEAKFREE